MEFKDESEILGAASDPECARDSRPLADSATCGNALLLVCADQMRYHAGT